MVSAWLNISKDAVIGVDQRFSTFWKRIASYYNKYRGDFAAREPRLMKSRWLKLNQAASRFTGCFKKCSDRRPSGASDADVMKAACDMYKSQYHVTFTCLHAWEALKDEPKWRSYGDSHCFN